MMNNNIKKYLDNDPDNPKYLFHGSPYLLERLEPQQSHDNNGNENNIANAIFMYPVFYKCVPYALKKGFVYNPEYGDDSWFETENRKLGYPYAVVNNRDIDENAVGYVYVFEKSDDMIKDPNNYQYRCFHTLVPIDVIEVKMKDYVDLFEIRYSNKTNKL